jgi:hypothetical protein
VFVVLRRWTRVYTMGCPLGVMLFTTVLSPEFETEFRE